MQDSRQVMSRHLIKHNIHSPKVLTKEVPRKIRAATHNTAIVQLCNQLLPAATATHHCPFFLCFNFFSPLTKKQQHSD